METLPDRSNFFCELHTSFSRERIASLYEAMGWSIRQSGWYEYETSCPWAELTIDSDAPILMRGPVSDLVHHLNELLAPLRAAAVSFQAECYGEGGELIQKVVELDDRLSG